MRKACSLTILVLTLAGVVTAAAYSSLNRNRNAENPRLNPSNTTQLKSDVSATDLNSITSTAVSQCKCYCGGQSWSIGSTACMGGFKQRCVDSNGDGTGCGWATVRQGSDAVRCDGGEHCR